MHDVIHAKSYEDSRSDMIILALDSGSDSSSAALRLPSGKVFQNIVEARHGHAERLASQIAEVMDEANCDFADVDYIAAGCGPGSFTGIRVCLAAATGLVLAGSAKPVGISLLDAILHESGQTDDDKPVVAVLDSRRNSVYALMSGESKIQDLTESDFDALTKAHPDFQLRGVLPHDWQDRLPHAESFRFVLPSAKLVANLAAHQIMSGVPLAPLQAAYLAPPKLGPQPKVG